MASQSISEFPALPAGQITGNDLLPIVDVSDLSSPGGTTKKTLVSSLQLNLNTFNGVFNVKNYGALGDGVADDTAAIADATTAAWTSQGVNNVLLFPPGTYAATSFPNWAHSYFRIEGLGTAILKHTGTGVGVTFDGSSMPGARVWGVSLKNIVIAGGPSTTVPLFINATHHSAFEQVRVYGGTSYAVQCKWTVLNRYTDLVVSGNEVFGAYTAIAPTGLFLDTDGVNGGSSVCTYTNLIIEGCATVGLRIDKSLDNVFVGGSVEACGKGVLLTANAVGDQFIGYYGELNTSGDVDVSGMAIQFQGCYFVTATASSVRSGAKGVTFRGGVGPTLSIESGALGTHCDGMYVGSAIVNNDPSTSIWNCYLYTSNVYLANLIPRATAFGERISLGSTTTSQRLLQSLSGSPEGVTAADPGSLSINPGTGAPWYQKGSGTGNTGWVPVLGQSVSANNGDASVTLTANSPRVQNFTTALTANRTITLPTTGLYNGLSFKVSRTGLGAFTLAVGSVKTLPTSTASWAEVVYDGAAWVLTGYGAL